MIRFVYLDAVGTVMHPGEPVADTYRRAAERHGFAMPLAEVERRMRIEYRRQEELDLAAGWRTSEFREFERWHAVVTGTFAESPKREAIFNELHAWFAQPEAWRVYPDVAPVVEVLQSRGLSIGLASNFDGRLRGLVEKMPDLTPFRDRLLISSEVGHRKPGKAFFDRVVADAEAAPDEILFIGDDRENDVEGPARSGIRSVGIDRNSTTDLDRKTLNSLEELRLLF